MIFGDLGLALKRNLAPCVQKADDFSGAMLIANQQVRCLTAILRSLYSPCGEFRAKTLGELIKCPAAFKTRRLENIAQKTGAI